MTACCPTSQRSTCGRSTSLPNAAHGAEFRALKAKTPARLGLGRCGARYPTASLLRFRADHAAAQDSVFSLVPERFWEENHYPFVQTMCKEQGRISDPPGPRPPL